MVFFRSIPKTPARTHGIGLSRPLQTRKCEDHPNVQRLSAWRGNWCRSSLLMSALLSLTNLTERASIDEAFIDLTRPVREELLKRYPYLAQIPPDAPDGRDSPLPPPPPISWEGLGTLVPVIPPPPDTPDTPSDIRIRDRSHPCTTPIDEELGVGENDELTTWHDVGLSIAAELMSNTRNIVHKKLGYTTSAVRSV